MDADDVLGLAAQMSYYFVLALFPFLIFLAALVGTLPFTDAWGGVLKWIMLYFPRESRHVVLDTVLSLTQGRRGFLSIGLLGTLWAASGGLMSSMAALNRVYEVKETRGYPKRLGLAWLVIFVLALLLLSTFGLLTVGDRLDQWLVARTAVGVPVLVLWRVGRWTLSVVLVGVGVAILDRTMPNLRRPWSWCTPGALFVVLGWLLGTIVFNLYVQYLATYNKTYGILGGFVILMVWIYLASLIILVGAEINSELHKMRRKNGSVIESHGAVELPAGS